MALSTMNSSAKRMWQKFFLLFLMAVISPHCSKTSWIISSVAFSGNPPTNTVLHPGGRSLVEGGGRSNITMKHRVLSFIDWLFTTFTGQKLGLQSSLQTEAQSVFTPIYIPHSHAILPLGCHISWSPPLTLPTCISHAHFHRVPMLVRGKDNTRYHNVISLS